MLNTCALDPLKKDGKIKGVIAQHFDEKLG